MAHLERALIFLALGAAGSAAAGPLTITDAWIRATPPGARTAAAYLTIANTGAADRLLGGTTPAARTVEVHTHVDERGLQRMVRLAELSLPAGETVRLTPGGLHLMLVDVARAARRGRERHRCRCALRLRVRSRSRCPSSTRERARRRPTRRTRAAT